MFRLAVLTLLLTIAAPAFAGEGDTELRELAAEYKVIRRSKNWGRIKERRTLLRQIGETGHPDAEAVLLRALALDREQICRIEAMRGLGAHGSFGGLRAMVLVALSHREEVYRTVLPVVLRPCREATFGPWLLENYLPRLREDSEQAAIIATLGHLACSEAWASLLDRLGRESQDPRLLVETAQALARIGGSQAFDPIVPLLKDRSPGVRAGAVIALGLTGHPAAVDKVLPLAKDKEIVVQVAVAETLADAKAKAAYPTLLAMLSDGRPRAADAACRALEKISGQSFGLDPAAWEHWCRTGNAPDADGRPRTVATYHGMAVHSDRVLFVLDVSGSMRTGKPTRLERAKEELARTLSLLTDRTRFNVVAFGGSPFWWKDSEVPATRANRKDALDFAASRTAGGGTNIHDTLEQALTRNGEIDTIFFLGDGSPSKGRHVEPEEILAKVRWLNRLKRVRINTIAFVRPRSIGLDGTPPPSDRTLDDEEAARFLSRLAEENKGAFHRTHP